MAAEHGSVPIPSVRAKATEALRVARPSPEPLVGHPCVIESEVDIDAMISLAGAFFRSRDLHWVEKR